MHRQAVRSFQLSTAVLLAALPTIAHAHGEQVLLVPFGQLVALVPAAAIAWHLTSSSMARTVVLVSAPLVPVVLWFLPNHYFPWWSLATDIGSFLTGFIASTVVALASRFLGEYCSIRNGMAPNSALVTDVCAAALRAFYNAAQRGR